MSQCWESNIKVLSGQIESLKITEEALEGTEYIDNMAIAPILT